MFWNEYQILLHIEFKFIFSKNSNKSLLNYETQTKRKKKRD